MGEIFAVEQPATPLQFTGERMTSDARGQIEYEHLHRYCFARSFCRGKEVIDAAAGEGYGSALLAQVATRVIGVEMAEAATIHATAAYPRRNLQFVCGDVRQLPLCDNSADVVVSFETIEHLFEQELFLAEIRRVLRPDGLLIISSPNSEVYSYPGSTVNDFHVRELTSEEFRTALAAVFPHVHFYSQRALIGSAMTSEGPSHGTITFERRSDAYVDAGKGLPRAPYIVGVASATTLDAPCQTLYVDLTRDAQLLTSRFGGASITDRFAALEGEAASLRAAVEQRDAALGIANDRAAASVAVVEAGAARENAVLAEIAKQQVIIGELRGQRDGAQLAAAQAVHERLAELRAALAVAECAAREREAKFEFAERELTTAREELTRGRDALTRAREELSTAEWQIQQHGVTIDARQRELADLRQALADADRKRREQARIAAEMTAARAPAEPHLMSRLLRQLRRHGVGAAIRAGDRAARGRNWAVAGRYYRRALDRAPGLAPIWVQLGHMLKEQGDYARAEVAYRRALALDGSVADTHLQLGHLLKLQARWDEAVEAYTSALQIDQSLGEAGHELDALCQYLIDEGDKARDARHWVKAALHYRRALDRQPGLSPIWVQLGHALKEQGDYNGAEAAYRRALALDEAVADTHLQLGHLHKLQARRSQAVEAYATAIRLEPDLAAARDALRVLVGYSPSETERALLTNGKGPHPSSSGKFGAPGTNGKHPPPGTGDFTGDALVTKMAAGWMELADRYGPLYAEASRPADGARDVIWLGVIDWHFRIQRPQHLASKLAEAGARVFYISLVFEPADEKGRFRIIESPHLGVFEVRMRLWSDPAESIYQGLSEAAVGELQLALDEMIAVLGIRAPIVLVEYPAWYEVACGVAGATIVYDCLDLATGFNNAPKSLAASEAAMLAGADLVVATSQPLVVHVAQYRPSVLVRNAAEVDFFAQAFSDRPAGTRPVIGYFGAIAEWFDIEWIERCAVAKPQWEFRLIGRTDGCDITRAEKLPNVRFYGEKPYQELPALLHEFDVALIPFKLVELTRCTNPVKLYEYMSAGKPVVAAPMPEVINATDLVYIADDAASFADRIAQALAEDTPALRAERQAWAREHTWANRARELGQAIDASFPLVSVIVLTYNNWDYTAACLFSLRSWSEYPNLEIIVVDNASTDGTRDKLRELARRDDRLRVIFNETNLGFPGGNNVGMRVARGDYVILLNNDTYVTRGWVRDLIRPMQLDPSIGLVGPLTNNIGNEQKVRLVYGSMPEMLIAARRFVRTRLRQTVETDNLAFFCIAIRRSVMEEVGLLDEVFGAGFFEDDDYCRRARQAGHRLVIADDVFVHHHLSVSFDMLGAKAAELMTRNRAIFEERWGPWQPHRYRQEAGFG